MFDFLRTLIGLFVTSYREQRVDNLNRKPPGYLLLAMCNGR